LVGQFWGLKATGRWPALRSRGTRHQMLTYLTSKGLTDAQIQLISGHESKKRLEVYQHLSLESVDKAHQDAVQSAGI
jgi:hypothetical protein